MATPAQPTKEQWEEVKAKLSSPYEQAYFLIDGYNIAAIVSQNKMRLVICIYVNGQVRGDDWWSGRESAADAMPEIARRFYALKRRALNTATEIKYWEKAYGKREAKRMGLYERYLITMPYFSTPGAFITNIKKHNEDIQIVDYETYQAALDQHLAAIAPEVESA